jgi:hypothetical protein
MRDNEPHNFIFCNSEHGWCECGEPKNATVHCANKECEHNQLQRSKERYGENVYVCGRCSKLFLVTPKPADSPVGQRGPMLDTRKPWGTRGRQA